MNFFKYFFFSNLLFSLALSAQENKTENGYNRWSLELNVGVNKAIKPFASEYSSYNVNKFYSVTNLNHYDLGLRYMLTSKFGVKLDFASDKITNQSGSASLPFHTQQYRIGFQGVINAGRILNFEEFSKTIGLLAHAGIQASQLTSQMGITNGASEYDYGFIFGVTPQIKIANKFVFTLDFTLLSNVSQDLNWDGSASTQPNTFSIQMCNTSLGLMYYFGKSDKHADWFLPNSKVIPDPEVNKRLDAMEVLMNDTDRDGIVDHLDTENNTPTGVAVDSKGRFLDINKNGIPDEMEPKSEEITIEKSIEITTDRLLKTLINQGIFTVFFDVNQDTPNTASINSVSNIIKFLHANPDTKVKFTGYADLSGNEQKNSELSKRRVQNMFDLLVKVGVQPSRMSIEGVGVDNSNPYSSKTSYDLARRVSIKIEN